MLEESLQRLRSPRAKPRSAHSMALMDAHHVEDLGCHLSQPFSQRSAVQHCAFVSPFWSRLKTVQIFVASH
jgi:hypothetical protein